MVFHFPHYQSGDGPQSALFLGKHKLIKFYEENRLALFEITSDISEQNDLSKQMPQKAAELDRLLMRYLDAVNAQMATPNPSYDSSTTATTTTGGRANKRNDPVLLLLDADGDGRLTTLELKAIPQLLHARDRNQDGAVTIQEVESARTERNRSAK